VSIKILQPLSLQDLEAVKDFVKCEREFEKCFFVLLLTMKKQRAGSCNCQLCHTLKNEKLKSMNSGSVFKN
jgi:hypothetical protein